MNEEKFNSLLVGRKLREANSRFEQSIISAAATLGQKHDFNFEAFLEKLFKDLKLPAPAYVLTAIMLLGFIIGVISPLGGHANAENAQSEIYYDGDNL